YFVRNGYDKPGQIAVLTPYLGQLIKIRDVLSKSFVVVIDERDDQLITDMEESIDDENKNPDGGPVHSTIGATASRKKLSQQVVLRTVDNFQGEEADIVIISLVRNTKNESDRGNIGFLKSTNRSNVLLSRAKHGMFLLGNAEIMARHSNFWKKVLEILRNRGQVGPGFPIVCAQHPDYKNTIYEAKQFIEVSPDGGCFEPCGQQLKCGHTCPYKCHPDDPQHIGVVCQKPCTRLFPDCQHPCSNKICGENCGNCLWPIGNITLPCGHEYKNAKCHERKNINKILCKEKVLRKLPKCEHEHLMECYVSVGDFNCTEKCGKLLPCEHPCMSTCLDCQKLSERANQNPLLDHMGHIVRSNHKKCTQKCERSSASEICPPPKYCADCTTDDNVKNQGIYLRPRLLLLIKKLFINETFAEVDWTFERMVVLDCGHVYTAESLDHVMYMKEYYEMDKNNNWVRIKSITSQPSESKKCPQCRAPIKNIYRYRRSTNKHVLDVQNKKFLMKYDNYLKQLNEDITNVTSKIETNRKKFLEEIQKPLKPQVKKETRIAKIADSTLQKIPEVVSTEQYSLLEKYYSIPMIHEKEWTRHISELLKIYRNLTLSMFETKSPPYKLAYEAAVSLLYASKTQTNICDLGKNFESLNLDYDSPACQQLKLKETLAEVGLIAPKIDVRMYLDAFFEIVNIQKVIFYEVSQVITELSKTRETEDNLVFYDKNWIEFGERIIEAIKKHLDIIITTAQQNNYRRHVVLSSLELAEIDCKAERFKLKYPPNGINPIIQKSVKNRCAEIENMCEDICNMLSTMNAEYFEEQCKSRIDEIRRELLDIRTAVMRDMPLTREEKLQISKVMNSEFQGSGHWYQCPNGHTYTIDACGGAMEFGR
ncbi:14756_t:CDS:10, partial [Racocetra persica]